MQLKNLGKVEFICVQDKCDGTVTFKMLALNNGDKVFCPKCNNEYVFNCELITKLQKFSDLIHAVRESSDILGSTNVSINVNGHSVKIPYRLLLTRLNTVLTLRIGDREIHFRYRVEPLQDAEKALMQS